MQTSPGQSLGACFENLLASSQPTQIPNAASRNNNEIQTPQSISGIGPVSANQPIVKQETLTIPRPRYQAIFFGSASTHSGLWGRTISPPTNIEGEYLALPKSRIIMSIMKATPKARSGMKLPVSAAIHQPEKPTRNKRPAAALTVRSLNTPKSIPGTNSPNSFFKLENSYRRRDSSLSGLARSSITPLYSGLDPT